MSGELFVNLPSLAAKALNDADVLCGMRLFGAAVEKHCCL